MSDTLIAYGFHNRKSWSIDIDKIIKNIPYEFEHHFLRGMFDGDGSIKYYKYDYQNVPFYHFGYTGLKNVCDYVATTLDVYNIVDEGNNLTHTVLTKNPKKIIEIYNYMYKDATIFMQRKYDTFQKIIEIEENRDIFYANKKQHANKNRDRCRYASYNGETHSMKEWSKIRNIKYATLMSRINCYNWSIGRALEYE